MLPYLVINHNKGTKVYGEIVYTRSLLQDGIWLHVTTADDMDFARYTATYMSGRRMVRGIYSVFAAEVTNDKRLYKGLFEPTRPAS
jgi:hypothetical protein